MPLEVENEVAGVGLTELNGRGAVSEVNEEYPKIGRVAVVEGVGWLVNNVCENLLELEVGNPKVGWGAVSVDAGWRPKEELVVPTTLVAFDG